MSDLIAMLPPEFTSTIVASVALVTALRALVVVLQRLAEKTAIEADDEALDRVAGVLEWLDRSLDWVSVGPTRRKR